MEFIPTEIPDVVEVVPVRRGDARGWFTEAYRRDLFADAGLALDFVQDNESFSATPGTIRGLHYQLPPFAQDKLVRVLRGSIFDVAVDIRRDSPTFGRHVTRTLSADAGNQLLVPAGFAHGFATLTADVHVTYKVTAPYAADTERSIRWDDADLAIAWPNVVDGVDGTDAPTLSDKDAVAPRFADQPDMF
ncbi:MAG: dTDP-4-dehydrorhamnose 3,5-epimerase [Ilumatobacter sp.]|uniref:dTDP-4-dehydrorhamnose 3,5-epimerase n=1 Tax=Ilumatobacter sp. TaxID=1967498 RepID=UPI003297A2C0